MARQDLKDCWKACVTLWTDRYFAGGVVIGAVVCAVLNPATWWQAMLLFGGLYVALVVAIVALGYTGELIRRRRER